MRIGSRDVGPGHPPYIIAEIGVNHDGDPARAISLVNAAQTAGADAVKLQLFEADRLMSKAARLAAYQATAGESDPVEMLRRLELSVDQMAAIVDRAHALGLHALVTVFSLELVKDAERLDWDAYKTASPDIINKPLLAALAATRKSLIVSTGAADLDEIRTAVDWLRRRWDKLALLHCVSSYPTPPEWASLPAMHCLRDLFRGPVGYSDHTIESDTGALAVRLGANILEKHITHDRSAKGPDHASSLTPDELCDYITQARTAHQEVGILNSADPRLRIRHKRVLEVEADVREVSRQSVTAARNIARGQIIRPEDLTLKRPGTGLLPAILLELIGRTASRNIDADQPLAREDVADLVLWTAA